MLSIDLFIKPSVCQYLSYNFFTLEQEFCSFSFVYSANTYLQNIRISFKLGDMHSCPTLFPMSPQTNSLEIKLRWYEGTILATTVIQSFLAERQMIMQTLVFHAENKVVFVMEECSFSVLHYVMKVWEFQSQ